MICGGRCVAGTKIGRRKGILIKMQYLLLGFGLRERVLSV